MAHYHPTEDMLADYATGAQGTALSLLVACHLTYCPQCRERAGFFDMVGGLLLDSVPCPAAAPPIRPASTDAGHIATVPAPAERSVADDLILPRPLRRRTGCAAADLPWRRLIPGVFEAPLELNSPGAEAKLMRICPGRSLPRHTHEGAGATLVLAGAFSDATGRYRRGDVALADGTVDHRPLADRGEDCICLAVTDVPVRLTVPPGRIVPLFRQT